MRPDANLPTDGVAAAAATSSGTPLVRRILSPRWLVALAWLAFQLYLLWEPLPLQIARPAHIAFALATVFLWWPLRTGESGVWRRVLDWLLLAATAAVLVYYLADFNRLYTRMENVDDVLTRDLVFGTLVLALVLECVRRVVGWSLLWVIGAFIAYAFLGRWFPGWLSFQGFDYPLFIEIMTMATHGILGVTTETSVNFVWYFILFGVVYSATGGGQLFIDAALRLVGRRAGGAAKAEIVASALFGTISGSAVANVVATGIFTIPLMKRTGYSPEEAAAHEATASTGGQLMPPVMGIAAFVMAELLATPYGRIALAGVIPAVAYYFALYMIVHLKARRRGIGTLSEQDLVGVKPIAPRAYLFLPPLILIAILVLDYSAVMAAIAASAAALAICYARPESRLGARGWVDMVEEIAKQSAQVAVPIIAIGIIIAVAIQSNLALKFSTQLIELSRRDADRRDADDHRGLHRDGDGPADGRRLHHRRDPVRARVDEARRRPARRALLRDVLLRTVDDHAAGRARVVRGCWPRQGRLHEDRVDRVQAVARAVPDPVRVRVRPGPPLEWTDRLDRARVPVDDGSDRSRGRYSSRVT